MLLSNGKISFNIEAWVLEVNMILDWVPAVLQVHFKETTAFAWPFACYSWALLIWITLGWFLEAWYRFDSCLQVPGSCIHASALWIWGRCLSTCKTKNNWEATLIILIYYFVFNSIYETKILKMEIWTRLFLTTRWWNLQMKWTFLLLEGKKHFINLTFS